MNESYVEYGVKKKETVGSILLRVFLILAVIAFFLFSFVSSFLLVFGTLMLVALFYIMPLLKVEFEYVFCDGQFDIDKIMGKSRRKRLMRIQFENVEAIAPEGHSSLEQFKNKPLKRKDYSSYDSKTKKYVIIVRNGDQFTAIFFEPSEKMLNCMRTKAPRKVIIENN